MSGIVDMLLEGQKRTDERKGKIKQLVNMVCGLVHPSSVAAKRRQLEMEGEKFTSHAASGFIWQVECVNETIQIWAYFPKRHPDDHTLMCALWGNGVHQLRPDQAKMITRRDSLDIFVEAMKEEFPEIQDKLELLISASED